MIFRPQFIDSLYRRLSARLEGFRVAFDPVDGCYSRREVAFVFQYQVLFREKYGILRGSADIGVRSDQVEDIFHLHSEFQGAQRERTATLGVTVRGLARSSDYDVTIETNADVDLAIDTLVRAFEQVAIPYWRQYGSLEVIDHVLNDEPRQGCIHMVHERTRCSKGLIVAKLVGRSNYDELLGIYDERMQRIETITYDKYFRPLVEHLKRVGPATGKH